MLSRNSNIGLLTGLVLGLAAAVGGFGGFLLAAVLGALGVAVGRYLDGDLDVAELAERARSAGPRR